MSKYLNYWWVTRPKRTLFSVPEVLAVFASNSLKKKWHGDTNEHRNFEDALEDNFQTMKKIFRAICAHPFRTLATIGMLALSIHWGFLGFMLLSVPMFALWENVNF
jgi:hypothetical protein